MMQKIFIFLATLIFLSVACKRETVNLPEAFKNPSESARPWTFWFWVKAGVSKEGITLDLEAMKEVGIGGAYLIPVQGAGTPPLFSPPVEQLSPEWWEMVRFAFSEAKRLGIKLGMHSCDGFAVAGGPWITPEKSMQKVVWSEIQIEGNKTFYDTLPQPETIRAFYKDIAIFAFPTPIGTKYSTDAIKPKITSNLSSEDLSFLLDPNSTKILRSKKCGWLQYSFDEAFTCRTIEIKTRGLNYASHRLIVESSDDGKNFKPVTRLMPPRHGWQDYTDNITHSIPTTTAKHFRFTYSTDGVEPGSEDLDAAKWSPDLKIQNLKLSGRPVIHQYRGKNGSMWRITKNSDTSQLPDSICIPIESLINLTNKVDRNGFLKWQAPKGQWSILRIGHTSTGHTNYIGGKGLGLECDKFDPEVVSFQFDNWFGKVFDEIDPELAHEVLKSLLIDSWECGSQNWSSVFRQEFKNRRGYDIVNYLPVMTGLPLTSAEKSENILYDVRKTINELISENFFVTMAKRAKEKGCNFSAESIAPVMVSDAMAFYKQVDIPMGEFWFNSPTHDKPNDILDAISAAHIYNKSIIQSEAFTTLRMDWDENPADIKTLGDRNFALGVNRFVFHVFAHNPWVDRKPGMTLNTVGLFYQRDQIWWNDSKAWIDYLRRCQSLLQLGKPVVDIAVFTGDEYPRRALTPDRLVKILPGLFGDEVIQKENIRLQNEGVPMVERPYSVNSNGNTFDPATMVDPLRGYKYDSFNEEALLHLAKVKDGDIVLPGGQTYQVLVIPGKRKASPNDFYSDVIMNKCKELAQAGATIIVQHNSMNDSDNLNVGLFSNSNHPDFKGKILNAPYVEETMDKINVERDLVCLEDNHQIHDIAWAHRTSEQFDIYFVSNQLNKERDINFSFRVSGKIPEIYNPQTGEISEAKTYKIKNNRTHMTLKLEANEAMFIVFEKNTQSNGRDMGSNNREFLKVKDLHTGWSIQFDSTMRGPGKTIRSDTLSDWTKFENDSIRYYSGKATYFNEFTIVNSSGEQTWIDLGDVNHTAQIFVNSKLCGIVWTAPYRVDISNAVMQGANDLKIVVSNSWKNRIIGDNTIYKDNMLTWTTAPFRIKGQPLASSGLLGPVTILKGKRP
jgi:hypothetical protein